MKALQSRTGVELLEARIAPASFTVTTIADSGPGSLRQAILDANARVGADGIRFSIQASSVIALLSPLPAITDSLVINGPLTNGPSGTDRISIDGTQAVGSSGLNDGSGLMLVGPGASGSSISGLAIYGFDAAGIEIVNCTGVKVLSNYLGLKPNGDAVTERMSEGVLISGGKNNVIGLFAGSDLAGGNAIGGSEVGIRVTGSAMNTNIDNNTIGLIAFPAIPRPNEIGILVENARGTRIGMGGIGNFIAANSSFGIKLNTEASGTTITRNRIGAFDADGEWLGSQEWGIFVDGAKSTTIGSAKGSAYGSGDQFLGNRISGNYAGGIWVHTGDEPVQILNNRIGTQIDGKALPTPNYQGYTPGNGGPGILVTRSTDAAPTPKVTISSNLISGNMGAGIEFRGFGNTIVTEVTNNVIGTTSYFLPKTPLPNGAGIIIDRANGVVIGSSAQGELGNVIVASDGDGILVKHSTSVSLLGNHIGSMPLQGSGKFGNRGHGIHLIGVGAVNVGFQTPSDIFGNTIASNGGDGIFVDGAEDFGGLPMNVQIYGNRIGTGATDATGNEGAGIHVEDARGVKIGNGLTPPNQSKTGGGNSINGNLGDGILIEGSRGVSVLNNYIGDNPGFNPVGNLGDGISLINSRGITIKGGTIVGNSGHGVSIVGPQTVTFAGERVTVDGVKIGSNESGTQLVNGLSGIFISEANRTLISNNDINAATGQAALVLAGNTKETEIVNNSIVAGKTGISVTGGERNLISKNQFTVDPDGMFVDLGGDGLTPNDPLDADSGPNTLLNSPLVLSAVVRGGQTLIRGEYRGAPNIDARIEYYVNGEFLAELNVHTDANGVANLALDLDTEVSAGAKISASATNENNTSEFSAAVTATSSREVIAKGSLPGQKPRVQLRDANTGEVIVDCLAFGKSVLAGIRVATADVDGDGIADLIATPRTGKSIVKVFSGLDGHEISRFNAGSGGGGIRSIAAGDLDGDGTIEIVVGRGGRMGGPVSIYDSLTGTAEARFTPFGFNVPGRLKLSLIDVDGDEHPEIRIGASIFGYIKTILLDPLTGEIERVARVTVR